MQILMSLFDDVSILFGMELAISKTKVVCNQYSKAIMELIRERKLVEGHVLPSPSQHNTIGRVELTRIQDKDGMLLVPVIIFRGERIEVVPHAIQILGAHSWIRMMGRWVKQESSG